MKTLIFVVAASLLAAQPATADLRLTLKDGRVSIVAKDVTVRQILTEWMRVGQTKIVNVDRIPGGPVTLELNNVTETQALDVLLRPLSGYIAAPRAMAAANLSDFDRIIIMPTLATARPALAANASPPPAPASAPVYQEAAPVRQTVEESPYVEASYEEQPAPDVPAPIMVAPVQANMNPATMVQHSQETRRPGVLGNGIVPVIPKNPPPSMPPSEAMPFGAVAVPGMMVPGAPPPGVQPPGAPVRRP